MSRHSVCCFFMLTSIGCSKLSDQLGVETKAHTSTTAVRNKSVRKSVNAQRNSEVVGIPKMKTLLTVMMILSQVQPAVGNGDASFCPNIQHWRERHTELFGRRSNFSSFFNGFYKFYCNNICEEYAHCIGFIEKTTSDNNVHVSRIKEKVNNKRIELDELKKQPRDAQKDKEGELHKLRADRNLLVGIFSGTSDMPTPIPLHSTSLYSDVYSKNGQSHFQGNYMGCAYLICKNQCDHNGESHRGKREVMDNRVTRNSQKAESKVYSKRPTQKQSYRRNLFFSRNQSHR
ncbi:MAG: hypothetical protein NQ127_02455 [Candidatus Cardinium sp.]|nr:hypothetical protein [Candidatus Cardinium sp.]